MPTNSSGSVQKINRGPGGYRESLAAFCGLFVLAMLFFWVQGYAPFGNSAVTVVDAHIQYVDFFAFLKDCFAGKNSLVYSLSSGLGQTNVGIFAYYLSSPVNLLLLFFDKAHIYDFFDIAVAVKLALAGAAMSFYLVRRFGHKINTAFVLLLSLGYSWMQYSIDQCSNIMWLDGMYMLPLILLGVYYAAEKGETLFLSLSVGAAILFNWYSAGIDCLFSGFWFIFELCLACIEQNKTFKTILSRLGRYLWGMLRGLLLSAWLFLPNVLALREGKGTFDPSIFTNTFRGNLISTLQKFEIGSDSSSTAVSLFCGSVVLMGCFGFFLSARQGRAKKRACAVLLLFSLLIFYWQPLFVLFSLLKKNDSYWFRYSYVAIFSLVFTAACFYAEGLREQRHTKLLGAAALFSFLLLLIRYCRKDSGESTAYISAAVLLATAFLLERIQRARHPRQRRLFALLLAAVSLAEMTGNAALLLSENHVDDRAAFSAYEIAEEKQIRALQAADAGLYRISQTSTRLYYTGRRTANYNESLAFNYYGIASYTSSPQNSQLAFLEKLGYRTEGGCITVVDTSILPADSLLGVRYVLSSYPIKGYTGVSGLPANGNKKVYCNPYAFPMAYTCPAGTGEQTGDEALNPFEYTNALYSELTGEKTRIYVPASAQKTTVDEDTFSYQVSGLTDRQVLYANIPWEGSKTTASTTSVNVNRSYAQAYACWLSPSVLYVPATGSTASVTLTAPEGTTFEEGQFYTVDLDALSRASKTVNSRAVQLNTAAHTEITCLVNAVTAENLILSIPYDKGWTVYVNGKKVRAGQFAGALFSIPLQAGANDVRLRYRVPGLQAGIVLSLAGAALCAAAFVRRRKPPCLAAGGAGRGGDGEKAPARPAPESTKKDPANAGAPSFSAEQKEKAEK